MKVDLKLIRLLNKRKSLFLILISTWVIVVFVLFQNAGPLTSGTPLLADQVIAQERLIMNYFDGDNVFEAFINAGETEWSWSLPLTASSSSDTGQTNYPYSCNSSQCVLLNSDGSVVTDSMGNTIYLPLESKNTEKGVRTPAGVKLVSGGKVAVPMPNGSVKILSPLSNTALNAADKICRQWG